MKGTSWDITEKTALETAAREILEEIKEVSEGGATVLALHGDLGAGKTTFVQTLAKELEVEEIVTSPTFVVMKNYSTKSSRWPQLIHIDAYRLDDVEELEVLGLRKDFAEVDNIICIEWAEKVKEMLPAHTLDLHFLLSVDGRKLILQTK